MRKRDALLVGVGIFLGAWANSFEQTPSASPHNSARIETCPEGYSPNTLVTDPGVILQLGEAATSRHIPNAILVGQLVCSMLDGLVTGNMYVLLPVGEQVLHDLQLQQQSNVVAGLQPFNQT